MIPLVVITQQAGYGLAFALSGAMKRAALNRICLERG